MTLPTRLQLLSLLTAAILQAQPQFEVASVKVAKPAAGGSMMIGGTAQNGRVDYHNVPLTYCISRAYQLGPTQRLSTPDWMNFELYDIQAKAAGDATEPQLMVMLQKLLADRFELKLHRVEKPAQIYKLTIAKDGAKLPAATEGEVGSMLRPGHLSNKSSTLDRLAQMLSGLLGKPVVDATGIKGAYRIELDWPKEDVEDATDSFAMTGGGMVRGGFHVGPSLFPALERQLGLRLVAEQGVMEEIVIDSARKTPIEN